MNSELIDSFFKYIVEIAAHLSQYNESKPNQMFLDHLVYINKYDNMTYTFINSLVTNDRYKPIIHVFLDSLIYLHSDTSIAEEELLKNDSQFNRRTYIRCFFSEVEGILFTLQKMTVELLEQDSGVGEQTILINKNFMKSKYGRKADKTSISYYEILPQQFLALQEADYKVEETGEVILSPKFISPKNKVAFVEKMLNTVFGTNLNIKSISGWEDFTNSIEIRNDITHPKNLHCFQIDDDELKKINNARLWFDKFITQTLKEIIIAINTF
ncbi:hypothetical protein [Anabaena lutea]|uniref:RiboL-PSP-HEPN domain-containing protein n=1 Tax=Anabaena lutea FACHB-196 TaxID=2692881 RepID=A0ABR8FCZ7_9NOST|nr:hypothetical protein [Anabaena lutea]MBD2567546.1 hypothetical protein [Anabaena lutea FACHB-196]